MRDRRRLNYYILQLFYHVIDRMKRRQVHLDEAWSLKRDKIQVIKGGNEQTKDNTGPVDLPQRAIDPTLPTANCSAENLPQLSPSIDFELLPANCSVDSNYLRLLLTVRRSCSQRHCTNRPCC